MKRFLIFQPSEKTYVRRFQDTTIFEDIFYKILTQGVDAGFVDPVVLFIDSTHVKANANKRKYKKKHVRRAARFYQDELEQEINDDREAHGKKRFPPKKKDENDQRLTKESTTDPESGYYVKGEREKQFAYSFHTACDRNGFVLGTIVCHTR